ncbi:MAG: hypothetical protein FJ190_09210 [Gammaproteobacteria bacterium]|nr:hypothetical protein [Gammaproteobacteria bacterium]
MALPSVHLSVINKSRVRVIRTVFLPVAAFCAVYLVAFITGYLLPGFQSPVIAASIGAAAVIVFMKPGRPYSAPWSLIGGHFISALILKRAS